MRVLITGSSGQIGTNLALRLLSEGHDVFGVDKRVNTWIDDDFRYLLQDLSGHYAAMEVPEYVVGDLRTFFGR
jgi:UDP-glucose 4-epimerase